MRSGQKAVRNADQIPGSAFCECLLCRMKQLGSQSYQFDVAAVGGRRSVVMQEGRARMGRIPQWRHIGGIRFAEWRYRLEPETSRSASIAARAPTGWLMKRQRDGIPADTDAKRGCAKPPAGCSTRITNAWAHSTIRRRFARSPSNLLAINHRLPLQSQGDEALTAQTCKLLCCWC